MIPNDGGGRCLPLALDQHAKGTSTSNDVAATELRQKLCGYLESDSDAGPFCKFASLEECVVAEGYESIEAYAKTIGIPSTECGVMEVEAFSRIERLHIKIYEMDARNSKYVLRSTHGVATHPLVELLLSKTGSGGGHYQLLRPKDGIEYRCPSMANEAKLAKPWVRC